MVWPLEATDPIVIFKSFDPASYQPPVEDRICVLHHIWRRERSPDYDREEAETSQLTERVLMAKRLTRVQFQEFPHAPRPAAYNFLIEEHEWYADDSERTLGVLLRDKIDDDWAYVVLQPDTDSVFRWASGDHSFAIREIAQGKLLADIDRMSRDLESTGVPRVLPNLARAIHPKDPFVPIVPSSRMNPLFWIVANMESHSPARGMIREVFRYYSDRDGNFIEQFQTTGFDARIWELYLHTYLNDCGFSLLPTVSPDFLVSKSGEKVAIEAVTANPTQGLVKGELRNVYSSTKLFVPPFDQILPQLDGAFDYKQEDFVPIKLGSALYSKLQKRYWESPSAEKLPMVLAIETFHEQASLHYTSSALATYLYGTRDTYIWDTKGTLVIVPQRVEKHSFAGKTIPSNFFSLPEAEHISAVLFSNSGTVSKFNRMGHQGPFHNPRITLLRFGECVNHDPNAVKPFRFYYQVGDPDWMEWWGQGLEMFHNPNAQFPIDHSLFPDIAHHRLKDGLIFTEGPPFQPFNSVTFNFAGPQRSEG